MTVQCCFERYETQDIVARVSGDTISSPAARTKPPQRKPNGPAPRIQNGGAGRSGRARSGRGCAAPEASPPSSAGRSKAGHRGDGGGVAPEELAATYSKQWDGGHLSEGPPAAAALANRRSKGTGGAQRNPAAGAQAFAPSGGRHLRQAGAARAVKGQSR